MTHRILLSAISLAILVSVSSACSTKKDRDNNEPAKEGEQEKAPISVEKEQGPLVSPKPESLASTLETLVDELRSKFKGLSIRTRGGDEQTIGNEIALVKAIGTELTKLERCGSYPLNINLTTPTVGVVRGFRSTGLPSVTIKKPYSEPGAGIKIYQPEPPIYPYSPSVINPDPLAPVEIFSSNDPYHLPATMPLPAIQIPVQPYIVDESTMPPTRPELEDSSNHYRIYDETKDEPLKINAWAVSELNLNASSENGLAESLSEIEAITKRCIERDQIIISLNQLGTSVEFGENIAEFHHPSLLSFFRELHVIASEQEPVVALPKLIHISDSFFPFSSFTSDSDNDEPKLSWISKSKNEEERWHVYFNLDKPDFSYAIKLAKSTEEDEAKNIISFLDEIHAQREDKKPEPSQQIKKNEEIKNPYGLPKL